MRTIELSTWARREHFTFFSKFEQPHFNMCANMDITDFYHHVKQRNYSFTVALVYLITRAANAIPEFRQRIHGGSVVEHEVVHPSVTILVEGDLFSFCTMAYVGDFAVFAPRAAEQIAHVKKHPSLKDGPGEDNLLFMTAIPWVSFTSFMHPLPKMPADSIPRFAWGKHFAEGDKTNMPLSVQGHHALMDGLHMGRYYAALQEYFHQPTSILGGG